jgi:DNA-binding MarR family transcriptional regulator
MMVVLKAMHEQGLVERTPHPRHANVLELHLTDVGREALSAARRLVEPIEQRLDEALPPADAAVLTELLTRVITETEPR